MEVKLKHTHFTDKKQRTVGLNTVVSNTFNSSLLSKSNLTQIVLSVFAFKILFDGVFSGFLPCNCAMSSHLQTLMYISWLLS